MEFQFIHIQISHNIAILELDDPSANTLTFHLLQELEQAFLQVEALPHIRGVVLIGKGDKFFSGGVNIGMLLTAGRQHNSHFILYAAELLEYMASSELPLVTIVNGHITGGGLELALIADFRIALADNYNIGFPEVRLGVIPGMGGTARLSRLVGSQRALELITQGQFISAVQAQTIGLVDELIPAASFRTKAIDCASSFILSKNHFRSNFPETTYRHLQLLEEGLLQLDISQAVANIRLIAGVEQHDAASVLLAINELLLKLRSDDSVFAVNIDLIAPGFCKDSTADNCQTTRLSTYIFSRIQGYGRIATLTINRPLSPIEVQLALNCDYRLWIGDDAAETQLQSICANPAQRVRFKGYLSDQPNLEYVIADLLDTGFYQRSDGPHWLEQFVPPKAAGLAIGYAKLAITQGQQLPLAGALLLERHLQEQLFSGPDSQEGMKAYLEKRPGRFKGF